MPAMSKSSASAAASSSIWSYCRVHRWPAVVIAAVLSICYYQYLNILYTVDEIYEVDGLREPLLEEQVTIRVPLPDNKAHLKPFIEKYALCPAVHEIQVIWRSRDPSSFVYTKTHSKLVFDIKNPRQQDAFGLKPGLPIATDGVMLLDANIRMSCESIKFMQTVWRSSQVVPVGLLPKLHRCVYHTSYITNRRWSYKCPCSPCVSWADFCSILSVYFPP
jgi:Glycosyl transferase family 64 domain